MTGISPSKSPLSASTHAYLAGLCDASSMVWTEAGMDYTISIRSPEDETMLLNAHALLSRHDRQFSPTKDQIHAIAHFLQGATGDIEHRYTTSRHTDTAESFLKRLYEDLGFNELTVSFSEHKTGADAIVGMRSEAANVLLELDWTVD